MCPSRSPKGKSRGWIIPVGGAEVKENNVLDKLENYGGAMSYDYHFYSLHSLLRYQMGEWSHDSWFFDMVNDSTNATHILSRIDRNEGSNLYLVPVDFHF